MMVEYTPLGLWADTTDLPDDAELATPAAAMWNTALEAALDRTEYLAERLLTWQPAGVGAGALGQKLSLAAGKQAAAGAWVEVYDMSAYALLGWMLHSTAGAPITFEVVPPHAMARLASVKVRLRGGAGAGHGSDLPASPCSVIIANVDGGTVDSSTTTVDPSATAAAYDLSHYIDCAGPDNDPLGTGELIWVTIIGESGAHAVADTTELLDITCTWTSEDNP